MDWSSVTGWVAEGGAKLGTKRAPPTEDQLPQIAQKLKEFGIQALLIIGGFEVMNSPNLYIESIHRSIKCIFLLPGLSDWSHIFQGEG